MPSLYKYSAAFLAGLLIGLCAMYYAACHRSGDRVLPSTLVSVETHTVFVPVRAYNKAQAEERGTIDKATAKAPEKELLQAADVETSDGKTSVAAVLNKTDGTTAITEHRTLAEWINRNELGLGIGLVDGSPAKGAQYRYTFGRIWNFYGTAEISAFEVDRSDNRHPWNAMLWGTLRW